MAESKVILICKVFAEGTEDLSFCSMSRMDVDEDAGMKLTGDLLNSNQSLCLMQIFYSCTLINAPQDMIFLAFKLQ